MRAGQFLEKTEDRRGSFLLIKVMKGDSGTQPSSRGGGGEKSSKVKTDLLANRKTTSTCGKEDPNWMKRDSGWQRRRRKCSGFHN